MVALTNFADIVKTAIEEKADIIFSGAGLPLNLPSFLKSDSTTKLAPIVSSARALKVICRRWLGEYGYLPDAVVVEGPKAGGHLGYSHEQLDDENFSLEKTVPEVVATVKELEQQHGKEIPVIAGGGIYSGEDIYNIMALGADAAQMGTRFVTTEECDASEAFKQCYIDAKQEDIEIIQSPVGMPGRALHNNFLQKVKEGLKQPKACPFNCIKTCNIENSPYCIMLALYNAFRGKMENGYAFCGSNAWRCDKIISVSDLIESLKAEYKVKAEAVAANA
jgi:NAD(P)H-dependent flavin oxidoreductase YrpB (nitropropane dioxygenase family)